MYIYMYLSWSLLSLAPQYFFVLFEYISYVQTNQTSALLPNSMVPKINKHITHMYMYMYIYMCTQMYLMCKQTKHAL